MTLLIGMDVVLKNGIECEVVTVYKDGSAYGMCNDDTGDVEFSPDDVAYSIFEPFASDDAKAAELIKELKKQFPNNNVLHNAFRHSLGSGNPDVIGAFRMVHTLNPYDHSPGVERFRQFILEMDEAA